MCGCGWDSACGRGSGDARAVPAFVHAVDGGRRAGRADAREGGGVRGLVRRGGHPVADRRRGGRSREGGRVREGAGRACRAGGAAGFQGASFGDLPRHDEQARPRAREDRERTHGEVRHQNGDPGASARRREDAGRHRRALPRARSRSAPSSSRRTTGRARSRTWSC